MSAGPPIDLQGTVAEVDASAVIRLPKCLLVLTKAQLVAALRRGKAFARRQALAQRQSPARNT